MFKAKKIFAQQPDYNAELERISWHIGVYDFERKLVDLTNDLVTRDYSLDQKIYSNNVSLGPSNHCQPVEIPLKPNVTPIQPFIEAALKYPQTTHLIITQNKDTITVDPKSMFFFSLNIAGNQKTGFLLFKTQLEKVFGLEIATIVMQRNKGVDFSVGRVAQTIEHATQLFEHPLVQQINLIEASNSYLALQALLIKTQKFAKAINEYASKVSGQLSSFCGGIIPGSIPHNQLQQLYRCAARTNQPVDNLRNSIRLSVNPTPLNIISIIDCTREAINVLNEVSHEMFIMTANISSMERSQTPKEYFHSIDDFIEIYNNKVNEILFAEQRTISLLGRKYSHEWLNVLHEMSLQEKLWLRFNVLFEPPADCDITTNQDHPHLVIDTAKQVIRLAFESIILGPDNQLLSHTKLSDAVSALNNMYNDENYKSAEPTALKLLQKAQNSVDFSQYVFRLKYHDENAFKQTKSAFSYLKKELEAFYASLDYLECNSIAKGKAAWKSEAHQALLIANFIIHNFNETFTKQEDCEAVDLITLTIHQAVIRVYSILVPSTKITELNDGFDCFLQNSNNDMLDLSATMNWQNEYELAKTAKLKCCQFVNKVLEQETNDLSFKIFAK